MLPLWRACSAFRANSSRFLSPGPSKFRGFHSTALLLKNHYETLGVPETADGATIKKAFYEKVRLYHPDVSPGNKEHQKIFIEVSDAYQVLRDTDQRREYDASLRGMSFDFGGGRPRSGRRQGESFGGNSFSEEDFMRMYSEQFHDVFEELQRATRNSRHRTAYGPRSYTQQTKDGNVRYEFHFGGSDFFGGGRRGGQMNPFEFLQMMDFNPFGRSKSYSADPSRLPAHFNLVLRGETPIIVDADWDLAGQLRVGPADTVRLSHMDQLMLTGKYLRPAADTPSSTSRVDVFDTAGNMLARVVSAPVLSFLGDLLRQFAITDRAGRVTVTGHSYWWWFKETTNWYDARTRQHLATATRSLFRRDVYKFHILDPSSAVNPAVFAIQSMFHVRRPPTEK
eukprot:TRINITY_DN1394_c0_g1_i2.p1 TRINITY_DN1394_c0_g1~~TRINITY_DN1394_c0_g1_i2.p1  ORF type:complete len:396 (-),score=39.53 TRINITY_DN1394_c0_g1_i2:143-1330(-)